MNILAIDTSNLAMGVALVDGEKVLAECTTNVRKNHSVRLMPTVTRLLEEVQLSPEELGGIVVARGPGSYTGVRIGVTAAKTLAWALRIPLVGVSSMEVIAWNASFFTGFISPLFDARRGQVYTGLYRGNGSEVMPVEQERIIHIDDWLERISLLQEPILFLGDDTAQFREKLTGRLGELAQYAAPEYNVPRAAHAARLGWKKIMAGDIDQIDSFSPAYLQLTEAEVKWMATQNTMKGTDQK